MTQYVHHVPGRLRVRSAILKRNPYAAAMVASDLGSHKGVRSAEASPRTGSITVVYDPDIAQLATIKAYLRDAGHLRDTGHLSGQGAAVMPARTLTLSGEAIRASGEVVAKTVFGVVVEKLIERSAVALVAALV